MNKINIIKEYCKKCIEFEKGICYSNFCIFHECFLKCDLFKFPYCPNDCCFAFDMYNQVYEVEIIEGEEG